MASFKDQKKKKKIYNATQVSTCQNQKLLLASKVLQFVSKGCYEALALIAISLQEQKQKRALYVFFVLKRQHVFTVLTTGFVKSSVKHSNSSSAQGESGVWEKSLQALNESYQIVSPRATVSLIKNSLGRNSLIINI